MFINDEELNAVGKVQSKGIYHGLPVFPESLKGLSAIITGANGISGHHMLRVLAESPERWTNIYSMSKRPPLVHTKWKTNVQHMSLDFLNSTPVELAMAMKENGVKADYIFFFSYIQSEPEDGGGIWSAAEELVRVNTAMLSNFLDAVKLAGITPKRVMLQTGAKNYGIHLGPTMTPQREGDPRVLLEPNFYYTQEDTLFRYCEETGASWNVVMPSFVLGAVKEAAMNMMYPLGIFGAIQAHLGRPLVYPGELASYMMPLDLSSAMLNGYLEEWAVLTPKAANHAFNACDNSAFTWAAFWPTFASWYNLPYQIPDDEKSQYISIPTQYEPPPRGFGPRGTIRLKYALSHWATDPEVQEAWKELSQKYNLQTNPFQSAKDIHRLFSFTDSALLMAWPLQFSRTKCHKLGWFGAVDTIESMRQIIHEFVGLRMLPPLPDFKDQ
ncbi:NAD dependent epimerase/dehydratase [Trichophyton equinum CBS 127.97]|uniref:NAD dependent epimerase/dehydratase n=1 Tax=Trichophyton equinum (strain ATCC MYA-4606 / CBS 127.97) TaxID=559882 RepID=F2PIB6_TRIEC|nr:NAD dependent epimerase/dehydratase [Trichophyton equinum CBS 127.97]